MTYARDEWFVSGLEHVLWAEVASSVNDVGGGREGQNDQNQPCPCDTVDQSKGEGRNRGLRGRGRE